MFWYKSTLPGTWHPCEALERNGRTVRVWQASAITARGAWCWSIDEGPVNITKGNRGVAKAAAKSALLSTKG